MHTFASLYKIVECTTKAIFIIPLLFIFFVRNLNLLTRYFTINWSTACLCAELFPEDCFSNDFSMQNRYYMHKENAHRYDLWIVHKENIGCIAYNLCRIVLYA